MNNEAESKGNWQTEEIAEVVTTEAVEGSHAKNTKKSMSLKLQN